MHQLNVLWEDNFSILYKCRALLANDTICLAMWRKPLYDKPLGIL